MTFDADTVLERDGAHLWHPYTQAATAPPPLPVVGARGAWLELADGRRLFDAISSWWTVNHGHGHPRIVEAIARQAETLDHVLLAGCTHPVVADVAARVAALAPGDLDRVFFSDCGSTAVEIGLKMAFQYWANRGRPEKRGFVCLEGAYHGDTVGAMSVGDPKDFHRAFRGLMFPVRRVQRATCHRCPLGLEPAGCDIDCLGELAAVLEARGDEIAAVMVEPMVQGAAGMVVMPPAFLRGVAELARRHEVLLVADEVATGFGRTGRMFAVEHAEVTPDIMCLAKGLSGGVLPLAATVASERVYEAFLDQDVRRAFLHGHTFTGNPIACAAAQASLDLFRDEPVLARVAALEAVHAARLPPLEALPRVADVRWLGSIGAAELKTSEGGYFDALGPRIAAEFLARGFLVRPLGQVVYTLPPFCTTPAELHAVYDAFEEILAAVG